MVRKDLKEFLETLPKDVTVVAATKYVGAPEMRTLYKYGITNFGENRVENFLAKKDQLKAIHPTWHFIGHLQTNKVRDVVNEIDVLHSLDSVKLAQLIEEYRTVKEPMKVFIEVSINGEPQKDGISIAELDSFIFDIRRLKKIQIVGLMGMAKKGADEHELLKEFASLKLLRDQTEIRMQIKLPYLSMGMSDDYNQALRFGATHIRLGRILYTGYHKQ